MLARPTNALPCELLTASSGVPADLQQAWRAMDTPFKALHHLDPKGNWQRQRERVREGVAVMMHRRGYQCVEPGSSAHPGSQWSHASLRPCTVVHVLADLEGSSSTGKQAFIKTIQAEREAASKRLGDLRLHLLLVLHMKTTSHVSKYIAQHNTLAVWQQVQDDAKEKGGKQQQAAAAAVCFLESFQAYELLNDFTQLPFCKSRYTPMTQAKIERVSRDFRCPPDKHHQIHWNDFVRRYYNATCAGFQVERFAVASAPVQFIRRQSMQTHPDIEYHRNITQQRKRSSGQTQARLRASNTINRGPINE